MSDWIYAIILGVIEGLTEFIPVSSTGMLLLAKLVMGLPDGFWDTFTVLIQLGAIFAVVTLYFSRLWSVVIPAAIAGLLLHDIIKSVLFESPRVVCIALILGGIVLLVIDRYAPYPTRQDPLALPLGTSLVIGLFQCLALVPGVSRSGATIVGSMLMGVEKRAAAEFAFFLAIPVMAGAFTVDAWKSRHELNTGHTGLVAVGFVVSFLVALAVIRAMLTIVTRRGYAPFGWLRILIGGVGLAILSLR